jgi:carbonic anhydrase
VKRTVKVFSGRSAILEQRIKNKEIGIIGGMHDLSTGKVSFYSETAFIS